VWRGVISWRWLWRSGSRHEAESVFYLGKLLADLSSVTSEKAWPVALINDNRLNISVKYQYRLFEENNGSPAEMKA